MKRYAMVTRIRPGKLQEYTRLHAQVWPGVLEMIRRCNVRNYSIYTVRLPDGGFTSRSQPVRVRRLETMLTQRCVPIKPPTWTTDSGRGIIRQVVRRARRGMNWRNTDVDNRRSRPLVPPLPGQEFLP